LHDSQQFQVLDAYGKAVAVLNKRTNRNNRNLVQIELMMTRAQHKRSNTTLSIEQQPGSGKRHRVEPPGKENDQDTLHQNFAELLEGPNEQLIASANWAINNYSRSGIVQQNVAIAAASRRQKTVLDTAAVVARSKQGGSNMAAIADTVARTAFIAITGAASATTAAFPHNNTAPWRATGRGSIATTVSRVTAKEITAMESDPMEEEDDISEITMAHETGNHRPPFSYPPKFY